MTLILVDENIPGAEQLLAPLGEVRLFRGRDLRAHEVRQADALLVRSVTTVNAALLEGSQVEFVGSTTIGTDHLDIHWLEQKGIRWCSAPGSNADSVVDYCLSAMCAMPSVLERLLDGGRVGIVGYGNVGSRLHRRLQALGIDCVACDPLLTPAQCPVLGTLDDVLACDFVSLHTPLTLTGNFPTRHLLSLEQLVRLPKNAVLLNAGRGEVLATEVLLDAVKARPDIRLVLDVWEHEPAISAELLAECAIATPHIAGYSQDGKWKGLLQVARALSDFRGVPLPVLVPPMVEAPCVDIAHAETVAELVRAVVLGVYDVRADDKRLRQAMRSEDPGLEFDTLRRRYPVRREVACARLSGLGHSGEEKLRGESGKALVALGVNTLLAE
ncbi:MAG TPA: erythronate-4-phosphate dehydrogenase [Spongiibacteraceae bacterium]|nr:erythronate-4-phosphate dehydrogenase [Spongiibacteraceae bacterium]HCS25872.1 erythronate-4-phosphate dehydrogenase [Spongiibacteraceae bacterium]